MRHSYLFDGFFNHYWLLILTGLILAAIIIFALLSSRSHKSEKSQNHIDDSKRETLNNFSGLVCAMLALQGDGLKQSEIGSNLGLPADLVAENLNEMEKEGLITRKWENENFTFVIDRS